MNPALVSAQRFLASAILVSIAIWLLYPAPARAQDPLLAVADTTEPASIAPEQSIDLNAEVNPPLPVAATDVTVETAPGAPANSVDSGIPRRFHYQFRLGVRSVYDDNINLSHDNRISDFYTSIEPAVMLGFGDTTDRVENYLVFHYLPAIFIFADNTENNSVQHVARLDGQYRVSRLTLTLSQMVQIMDGVDVQTQDSAGSLDQQVNLDVAGRTRFNIYSTHLNAAYYVTGKTFLSSGVDYTSTDYSSLISSEAFSANFFVNYNYSPKFVIGLGGTAGTNRVDDPNPDQDFEQVNVRMSYQATGKIDLVASGGIEFRQFDGDMRDEYTAPVFEIGVNYVPFNGTRVSLTANSRILNSAVLAAQNYSVTNVTVGLQQRLLQRFYVGINAGYESSDYFSTVGAAGPERNDSYFFVEPSIAVQVTRFWSVGAYYMHRENDSSFDAFTFHDNQVGFRSTLTF